MLLETEHEEAAPPSKRALRNQPAGRAEPEGAALLERRVDGKLWLRKGGDFAPVEVVRCFPWSQPERFLSLRDASGSERAFIGDLSELDTKSQTALRAGLVRSGFVLEVTRVLGIEENFELRSFSVETAQGPRRFQTALDAWPRELEGGAVVLEDVHGDLYRLSAPQKLDAQSRRLLRALID